MPPKEPSGPKPIYRSTKDERMYERKSLNMEEARARAKEVLAEYEINPTEFIGAKYEDENGKERIYTKEEVERDQAKVKLRESQFGEDPSKYFSELL